jgi:hypothetical protein
LVSKKFRWIFYEYGSDNYNHESFGDGGDSINSEVTNMEKSKWTREDWEFGKSRGSDILIMSNKESRIIAVVSTGYMDSVENIESEANAKRIVQCVNACKGIENPGETIRELGEACKKSLEVLENHHEDCSGLRVAKNVLKDALSKLEGVK